MSTGKIARNVLKETVEFLHKKRFHRTAAIFASILVALRTASSAKVTWDGEDWIYSWNGTGAVHASPIYNPDNNFTNISLFFQGYEPREGDVIVDVGVENGEEIPVFCSRVGPSGTVLAIEADPACCRRLRKLKSLLQLDNLFIIEAAVGAEQGQMYFSQDLGSLANRLVGEEDYKGKAIRVQVDVLENLMARHIPSRIDFLKVNIEGAEIDLLKGLSGSAEIRNMCISCHDFLGPRTRSYDFVFGWLTARGYQVKQYEPQGVKAPWRNYYLFASQPLLATSQARTA